MVSMFREIRQGSRVVVEEGHAHRCAQLIKLPLIKLLSNLRVQKQPTAAPCQNHRHNHRYDNDPPVRVGVFLAGDSTSVDQATSENEIAGSIGPVSGDHAENRNDDEENSS